MRRGMGDARPGQVVKAGGCRRWEGGPGVSHNALRRPGAEVNYPL